MVVGHNSTIGTHNIGTNYNPSSGKSRGSVVQMMSDQANFVSGMVSDQANFVGGMVTEQANLVGSKFGARRNLTSLELWNINDKFIVIKQGTQKGKTGVVSNPDWNGRIKVKMDVDGAVKSYASHEIKRRAKVQAMAMPAFTTRKDASFARKKDNKMVVNDLRQYLDEEGSPANPNSRVANDILQTDSLMNARTSTYFLLCVVAFIGAVVSIVEVEILSDNGNVKTPTTDTLKWVVTATTICSLWLLFVYYSAQLALNKAFMQYTDKETLLSTGLIFPMLLEMVYLAIHPCPGKGTHAVQFVLSAVSHETDQVSMATGMFS